MHAHIASGQYDPTRSAPITFYTRVIENKVIDLGRWRQCERRDKHRERTLDAAIYLLDEDDPTDDLRLRMDVDDAIAELPPKDQAVATELKETNLAAAARDAGLTREQARAAKRRITAHLSERGLKP